MPKIQYPLLRLEGFPSGTILDINMGYYDMSSRSKQELDQLEYLKVIKKFNRSQWGAPTFLMPWKDKHQKCFDATKCVIRREVLLGYPDVNAPFEIHTGASGITAVDLDYFQGERERRQRRCFIP